MTQNTLNLHLDPAYSAAIAHDLLEKTPQDPILLAIAAFAKRDHPEAAAVESIEKALQVWSDEPEWHTFAANNKTGCRQLSTGCWSILRTCPRIAPKSAHYWQLLGDVKLLEKDYHAAKDYFGKAFDLFPENPEALGFLLRSTSNWVNNIKSGSSNAGRKLHSWNQKIRNIPSQSSIPPGKR